MKYQYFSSPYKLNLKLKNIESYNNSIPIKNYNIKSYDPIINSIPFLTNQFCSIKNRISILNKSLNKIPLVNDYSTTTLFNNSNYPSNAIKSPIKFNNGNNRYNNLTLNNVRHRKIKSEINFNQFKCEEKLENLNKKLRKKDFIIKNMQEIIDDTLYRLNKTNKENFLLHNEVIKLKNKNKYNTCGVNENEKINNNNFKRNIRINNRYNKNEKNKNNLPKEIAELNKRLDNILYRSKIRPKNNLLKRNKN